MLNELFTIAIITHKRPYYVKRLLTYLDGLPEKINVIVIDSNTESQKDLIASYGFKNLNLKYHYYPYDTHYLDKVIDAIRSIDTKYATIHADDDFLLMSAMKDCVEFLETHPSYSACHGKYIAFSPDSKGEVFFHPSYNPSSLENEDPAARLMEISANYVPLFYSIQRTQFLVSSYELCRKWTTDHRFGEMLPTMLLAVWGKVKVLENPYYLREAPLFVTKCPERQDSSFYGFQAEGTLEAKLKDYVHCLGEALAQSGQYSKQDADVKARQSIEAHLDKYFPNYQNFKYPLRYKVKVWLQAHYPFVLRTKRKITSIVLKEKVKVTPKFTPLDLSHNDEIKRAQKFINQYDRPTLKGTA